MRASRANDLRLYESVKKSFPIAKCSRSHAQSLILCPENTVRIEVGVQGKDSGLQVGNYG